jgi:hypothetical protein
MKAIRTTVEGGIDGIATQIYNDKLLVMTDADYKNISEIFDADRSLHEAIVLRFQALENLVNLLLRRIDILEHHINYMESLK